MLSRTDELSGNLLLYYRGNSYAVKQQNAVLLTDCLHRIFSTPKYITGIYIEVLKPL